MTDLELFVADAIKTESTVDVIKANQELLINTISIMINAGNILDQIKKNAFYDKPYELSALMMYAGRLEDDIFALNSIKTENILDDKTPFYVNPRMFHSIIGIATESTELLEALDLSGKDMDNINIAEEFGDIDWYKAIATDEMKIPWDTILATVINKLKKRYPNAYKNEDAINRNLYEERKVLEEMETKQTPGDDA